MKSNFYLVTFIVDFAAAAMNFAVLNPTSPWAPLNLAAGVLCTVVGLLNLRRFISKRSAEKFQKDHIKDFSL